ncbi:hypothetical protein F9H41_11985 [Salmonella enterica subsp. enterica serovar Montevideo]|uniref:Uncharacterized protein n=3 Tax=Salmonella enterica TaxID=28901 RepID=A0A5J1SV44_SALET|nr:hypothetical protein [Salmonella enterica subsp. enterica serovar Bredeney]EAA4401448.1 hypothetical protein [Salmonella enterica subsp. enterica serovar London]EAB2054003.1 hypothetical protein [Salmonella enterica]EAB6361656.1 hypothetical protein [Salmonella enterica subsp. enterica serovar Hadar]EAB7891734.1 hypothetical protein [Salmonella enterica subsp. enterica serovar Newport]EBG0310153.1 hypothetical protein [Salmonella enterica subsp. enterica serovar Manhattan]EBV4652594.1 hypo
MAVHPWDVEAGHVTPDGAYLSPVNAITHLNRKLSDLTGNSDIAIIMITGSDNNGFIRQLSALADAFPLPTLTQTLRRAKTQLTQAITRMQIPATPQNGLPAPQPLIVSTLQNAVSNSTTLDAMKAKGLASIDSLKNALSGFQAQRQQLQQQITDELAGVGDKVAKVFAFVHTGDAVLARREMMKNIPHPTASLTYAHLFTGDLSGMLNWITKAENEPEHNNAVTGP